MILWFINDKQTSIFEQNKNTLIFYLLNIKVFCYTH